VTLTRTYGASSDLRRDFTTVTEIEGRQEVVRGFACRQSDGTKASERRFNIE
jgi:surface antigen